MAESPAPPDPSDGPPPSDAPETPISIPAPPPPPAPEPPVTRRSTARRSRVQRRVEERGRAAREATGRYRERRAAARAAAAADPLPRSVRRYLTPFEADNVIVCTRRHWVKLAKQGAIASGIVLLASILIGSSASDGQVDLILALIALGAIGWFGYHWLYWSVERFVVTPKRVMIIRRVVVTWVAIMPITKVTDLTFRQSFLGEVLRYGRLDFESAGQQQALHVIDYLPHPMDHYDAITGFIFGPKAGGGGGAKAEARSDKPAEPSADTGPRAATRPAARLLVGDGSHDTSPLPRVPD